MHFPGLNMHFQWRKYLFALAICVCSIVTNAGNESKMAAPRCSHVVMSRGKSTVISRFSSKAFISFEGNIYLWEMHMQIKQNRSRCEQHCHIITCPPSRWHCIISSWASPKFSDRITKKSVCRTTFCYFHEIRYDARTCELHSATELDRLQTGYDNENIRFLNSCP